MCDKSCTPKSFKRTSTTNFTQFLGIMDLRRSRHHAQTFCRFVTTHSKITHYEALSVRPTASQHEIRQAFLTQAKLFHPDVYRGPNEGSFVRALVAYEALSDAKRRHEYDTRLRSGSSVESPWASKVHATKPTGFRETPRTSPSPPPPEPEDTRSWFEQLKQSFSDAIDTAAQGPAFAGGREDWPYAFELEQRTSGAVHVTDDIVQLCVGRTLLGQVRGRGLHRLHASETHTVAMLEPGARAQVEQGSNASENIPSSPSSSPPSSTPPLDAHIEGTYGSYDTLELVYQGRVVATAVRHLGAPTSQTPAQTSAARGADENAPNEETSSYITVYAVGDGGDVEPLAHILSPVGLGALNFRRLVSCRLVNPHIKATAERAIWEEKEKVDTEVEAEKGSEVAPRASTTPHPAHPTHGHAQAHTHAASMHTHALAYGVGGSGRNRVDVDPRTRARAFDEAPTPYLPAVVDDAANNRRDGMELASAQSEVRARVMQAALDDLAEGVWRKHTVRLTDRNAVPSPVKKDVDVMAARTRETSIIAKSEGNGKAFAPDGTSIGGDGRGEDLADLLCSPRLHRLSDQYGGARVLPRARAMLAEREERAEQKKRERDSGGLSSGDMPSSSSAFLGRTAWNASHWWGSAGMDGTTHVPTFSSASSTSRTWRDTPAGKAWLEGQSTPSSSSCPSSHTSSMPFKAQSSWTCPRTGQLLSHDPAYVHSDLASHTLFQWRTPGTSHLRFVRNVDGAIEASASRVPLPHPSLWLWEPRSRMHVGGNYYFELARRRAVDAALHPAVYVLTAAVLTLESEVDVFARQASLGRMVEGVRKRLGTGFALRLGRS